MAIYLVQHAQSLPRDQDPEKGISKQGRADTERIAGVAKGYHVAVSEICHSGKKRARQTAEIFAEALGSDLEAREGLNPMDNVKETATELDPESNRMIVGHLPHLELLAAWMVTGQMDHPVFKFQNSGIVCLDKSPDAPYWVIKWTLMPEIG